MGKKAAVCASSTACTLGLAGADVGSVTTVTFLPLPFFGCFAGIRKW